MSRQKNKINNLVNQQKPPSFKLTGLIVLCTVSIMLFGFSPEVNADPTGPVGQLMTGLSQTIDQAIQQVTDGILNLL